MKINPTLEQLLSWRSAQAELEAPPAPSAARLLDRAKPWWQRRPALYSALVAGFDGIDAKLGHAMEPDSGRGVSHPVPTVIARTNVETNLLADILYVYVRGKKLRLRFQLPPMPGEMEPVLEVTFLATDSAQPYFSSLATVGTGGEYRLELEMPDNIASAWQHLRVRDRMPFRFILRPAEGV